MLILYLQLWILTLNHSFLCFTSTSILIFSGVLSKDSMSSPSCFSPTWNLYIPITYLPRASCWVFDVLKVLLIRPEQDLKILRILCRFSRCPNNWEGMELQMLVVQSLQKLSSLNQSNQKRIPYAQPAENEGTRKREINPEIMKEIHPSVLLWKETCKNEKLKFYYNHRVEYLQ